MLFRDHHLYNFMFSTNRCVLRTHFFPWKLNLEAFNSLLVNSHRNFTWYELQRSYFKSRPVQRLDSFLSGPFGFFPREDIVRSFTDL